MINNLNSDKVNRGIKIRTEQLVETSVFLFLIVSSMAFSFFAVKQGNLGFVLVAFATILRDLSLVGLILFFIWRNGESVDLIGWTFKNVRKDVAIGIVLFIPLLIGAGLLETALRSVGFSAPLTPLPSFLSSKGVGESLLAFILVLVVAFTEETIFRGYLILRFKAIIGSPVAAAVLSSAIFSLGHGYEGSAGAITVGVMGLVLAIVYLWRQSLVAPIIMHLLQDFIGVVLPSLAGVK